MAKNIYQQRRDMVGQSAPGGSYFTRPGSNNFGRFGNAAFGTPATQIKQDAMFSGGASAGAPMTKPAWSGPGSIGGMIANVTPGFTGDNNNIPKEEMAQGSVAQSAAPSRYERLSPGMYRNLQTGKLVRSAQDPDRRAAGTVGGMNPEGNVSFNTPGSRPDGFLPGPSTGGAVGTAIARPSSVPFAGTRSEGFLSANGRIMGTPSGSAMGQLVGFQPNSQPTGGAEGSAMGAMPGNGQGYGFAAGSAVGRPMPTAGSAQGSVSANIPGPQTGGPLVSALGGMNQPQAQDPQAAFRKYQIQRGQMQQQAGGPQNYSLTRMMPDGSMIY